MPFAALHKLTSARRRRWGRALRDVLLLPPALLYVLVEHVFWRGARRLLRQAGRLRAVEQLHSKLARLPAAVVLPLFLVPEILSHVGGFWASVLLVRRHWAAAALVGLLVKGTATLLVVWIYQACEPALMSVAWFAGLHCRMLRLRDWVDERTRAARGLARRLATGGRRRLASRFAALRSLLARRLGVAGK